jgi:hypothetical protein
MNLRNPFEFSPALTFPRFVPGLIPIGVRSFLSFSSLVTILFSASSVRVPRIAYLIENTRLRSFTNHLVFNQLRIADAYISRKSSVHINLRIGYRGCTSLRASRGADLPRHAFTQREPNNNYCIFNQFRTLLHSFPSSSLLSISSPIQRGYTPDLFQSGLPMTANRRYPPRFTGFHRDVIVSLGQSWYRSPLRGK